MTSKLFTLATFVIIAGLAYLFSVWSTSDLGGQLFQSTLWLVALYVTFRLAIEETVARRISNNKTRYSFRKTISLLFVLAVIVVWLRLWVPDPQTLLVAYGVVAAGLAVALQDVVKNLAGSITIFLTGMFQVGNRIEIDGTYGDVIDIGLFSTTLLEIRGWMSADQATGRITTIPNGLVLNRPVQNFNKHHHYLWDELSVVVTSESDWGEAMRLLSDIGQEHTKDFIEEAGKSLTRLERYYYVEGRVLDPNVYVRPGADGYELSLRYVVEARQRRTTNSNIWGHVLRVFDEHDRIFIAPNTISSVEYPLPR